MSALDLIDLLENKDLISERRVKKLRQQVNAASKPITAANLAKLLVKNGHLTESQAKKLLQQLEQKQVKPEESDTLELLPDEPVAATNSSSILVKSYINVLLSSSKT